MQIPRHWRLNSQRYALQGVTCPHCAANIFPPRDVCPYCAAQTETSYRLQPEVKVVAASSRVERAAAR